jgi:hypothetical protein
MALAASLTTRDGVAVWKPSGTGFTEAVMKYLLPIFDGWLE